MELKDYVKAKLLADGLNGLIYPDLGGCACHVEDLMPCGEPHPDCKACVLKGVVDCGDEECEWRGEEHFHEAKPTAPAKDVCPECGGTGLCRCYVHCDNNPCPTCHGTGKREDQCFNCGGYHNGLPCPKLTVT